MPEKTLVDAPAIALRGVTKKFRSRKGKELIAVDNVTLEVSAGTIAGVIGYSGAGKSTLVRLINGLEKVDDGQVLIDGEDISAAGERQLRRVRGEIGMIFQQFNLFASRTVAGNVEYPLKVAGMPRAERADRAAELLNFVGIGDKSKQYPQQLSGGQKQRVGIARALATNPKILLADEATSALDPDTTTEILALLRRVNQEFGTTIVVITHEMDVVREICDHVAVLDDGNLAEHGKVYDVFSEPSSPITRRLVRSAIGDIPTDAVLARLRSRHQGRLLTVAIREFDSDAGDVTAYFAVPGVSASVIFGGITELSRRPIGSLTFAVQGPDAEVDRVIERLRGLTTVTEHHLTDKPLAGEA
ncbi:D-methionine transport system ATP-binding protein [Williamsia limnetica]|uniref:D-methionine transport system ATP-binding protein n=1 Tax=Williamsia limnetica TaxID=882452 RepID=A0A318RTM1_WILLI|nr:methionine ABC transporter ATP-binding protein [Williamsia limnetica]PYE19338.1 D-methionine transport system ATP-binding protein [Williamsia limnetica]